MDCLVPLLLLVAAFLWGGLSPGYALVRWRLGRDVREQGSGATGATNAGRQMGASGFAAVLALDAAKGALAAWVGLHATGSIPWAHAIALSAVAGHIWPPLLGWRGGKGIAPFLGAWLVLCPLALLPILAVAAAALALSRRFTASGLLGVFFLSPSAYWAARSGEVAAFGATTTLLLFISHRENLRALLRREPKSTAPVSLPRS